MKHTLPSRLITLGAALLLVASLSSCASGIERRITKNPAIYNQLSEGDKALVSKGQIREGMSKHAVFIAWGQPARKMTGKKKGQDFERWNYVGYDAVPTHRFGVGYGRWGYARGCDYYDPFYSYGPSFDYVPYDAGFVEFTGSKVSAFAVPR
jgi:hypothetical protein